VSLLPALSIHILCTSHLLLLPSGSGYVIGEEEVILDENVLAEGKKFCDVGSFRMSPDHRYLAYSEDNTGYETYTIYIKDLSTGQLLGKSPC
jgi:oligopeptidase B